MGDERPKRRPREAQAWPLRGLTKTLCKWIRKWLRAVVATATSGQTADGGSLVHKLQ